MFRIHDILVWIRIRGFLPLTYGPDPDLDPAIFVNKNVNKKLIFLKNHMFLGLPDPDTDSLVRGMDPEHDPDPYL